MPFGDQDPSLPRVELRNQDLPAPRLICDPCREDGYRLAMRAYVRRGERAQALRQYRLCEHVLRREFDTAPEPLTTELFERIRASPAGV